MAAQLARADHPFDPSRWGVGLFECAADHKQGHDQDNTDEDHRHIDDDPAD